MKRKDDRPQIVIIGQRDFIHKLWVQVLPNFNLCLYRITPPDNIYWPDVDHAHIVITELNALDLECSFTEYELLDTALHLYKDKKIVVAETHKYDPDVSAKAKAMGANGYIYRNVLEENLGEALQILANGKPYFMGNDGNVPK